mmetsp:Transcript_31824/g.35253  ORF Transcript_31824/g.35253 Transcript_31824/m.35253 type:complete len:176 (-) Transcript_31824:132-659(-)
MKISRVQFYIAASTLVGCAAAFSMNGERRDFLQKGFGTIVSGGAILTGGNNVALAANYSDYKKTDSGLQYKITKEGTGGIPQSGQSIKTQYTGWLDGFESEKKFDSSRDRGKAFNFKVGTGGVIKGWDEAFLSMKVGERRNIIIPPALGYGDRGAGGVIPGGATLYFDVELVAIQ